MTCCTLPYFPRNPSFAERRSCKCVYRNLADGSLSAMDEMKRLVDKHPDGYDGFSG